MSTDNVRLRQRVLPVLALLLLALLAWLCWPRTARRDRLIEEMWAEERATDPRPSHVSPPLPGTFGERLEPHLAGLAESYDSYKQSGAEGMAQIARVYNGTDPVAKLGPGPLSNFALHRRALEGALRATHAGSARAPAPLRLFATLRPGDPFAPAMRRARAAACSQKPHRMPAIEARIDGVAVVCVQLFPPVAKRDKAKGFLATMEANAKLRAQQARAIVERYARSGEPVVLAGDLNEGRGRDAYATLRDTGFRSLCGGGALRALSARVSRPASTR